MENSRSPSNPKGSGIADSIERNADILSGRIPSTAYIKAPSEEHLRVELVPLGLVKRLDEVKEDSGIFQGIFWTLMGTLLGVVTSLILSNVNFSTLDRSVWVLVFCLIISGLLFGVLWIRNSKKTATLRDELYRKFFE